jgi:SAM-dependent methyltransferase
MNDRNLAVEARTRAWLESSYRGALAHAAAHHEPVWEADGRPRRLTGYAFQEIQRKLKIFRWLDRLRFASVLDVGSGFDVYPNLMRDRYGATACFSDFVHTMNLPYGGAASGKLDRAVTLNAARLPFADGAFDVVLASEVLEHLVHPLEVIAELLRVSRTAVIMTSLEAWSTTRWQRWRSHWLVDVRRAHIERNFFLLPELEAVFGSDWRHENLFYDADLPASAFRPETEQDATYAALRDVEALTDALCRATAVADHRPGSMGILIVKAAAGAAVSPPPPAADRDLVRWLVAQAAAHERFTVALARALEAGEPGLPDPARPLDPGLCARLRCPDCRAAMELARAAARCTACGAVFRVEYGVPIMYPTRPLDDLLNEHETLQRLCGADPARRRIVRRLMHRLRRNQRPAGALRRLSWRVLAPTSTAAK